jgi:hypothetical protein
VADPQKFLRSDAAQMRGIASRFLEITRASLNIRQQSTV